MSFWDKFRKKKPGSNDAPTTSDSQTKPPVWVAATNNRFGVAVLDLTPSIGGLTSFSKDPEQASKAVSWGSGIGKELFTADIAATETIDCSLRYPADSPLPNGLLFCPSAMEDKWVFALHGETVRVARSWTGEVPIEAHLERHADEIEIVQLRCTEASPLSLFGDPVAMFDWMLRTHALGQFLPLPVSDDGADLLENTPLVAFSTFGNKALCAAKAWVPPPPLRPLRSDGVMLVATRASDVARLRELAASGEPVDVPTTHQGFTPLLVAAVKGELELVQQLLDLGADPNKPADNGAFALIVALVHGAERRVLETLVDRGADPRVANDDGFGALHAIAELDNPDALEWFLGQGLDIELRTNRGHTPVQIASALGHLDALQALANAGADLTADSPDGTARDIAAAQNKPAAVELLDRLCADRAPR